MSLDEGARFGGSVPALAVVGGTSRGEPGPSAAPVFTKTLRRKSLLGGAFRSLSRCSRVTSTVARQSFSGVYDRAVRRCFCGRGRR